MFCSKCGKEIDDEAVVCVHCGCATGVRKKAEVSKEPYKLSTGLSLLGFFVPLVVLIMGIVELSNNDHSPKGTALVNMAIAGIVAWIIIIGSAIAAMYLA